ncbi:hypothetical protein ACFLUU_06435 [Chloroflexota bacterium]
MMKVGTVHHRLAYAAAAASALSVILAAISKLVGGILGTEIVIMGATPTSYLTVATVGILFAIYFLAEGAVYSANKGKK